MAAKNIILAEGPDDRNAIYHLLARHYLQNEVELPKEINGLPDLLKGLSQRLRPGGLERFAVVVDADAEVDEALQFEARWTSVRDRLRRCGYQNVPAAPDMNGTVIDHEELPRVGVWLMPDNVQRGALEDFARLLMDADDILYPYAQSCVDALPQRRFRDSYLSKAYLHTWLAWQAEPGKPIGQAITKRYLNPDASIAQNFVAWICRVFDLAPELS